MSLLEFLLSSGAGGISDLFQTDIYTGNGTSQTITNGLNLSGDGGLVWIKNRDATDFHVMSNTEAGIQLYLQSNATAAEVDGLGNFINTANTDGFSIGNANQVNTNTEDYVSWSWKKETNFFDIVTYAGNSTSARDIPHNLNAVPGIVMVKQRTSTNSWTVFHSSIGNTQFQILSTNGAAISDANVWENTSPTSSVFTVGSSARVNTTGQNYVALLFSEDNPDFVKINEYTGNGSASGPSINLGFQPQFVLIKQRDAGGGRWVMFDDKRGDTQRLNADVTNIEDAPGYISFTATGFDIISANLDVNQNTSDYIYMAIRAE